MDQSDILGAAEYEGNVLTEPEPISMAFEAPDSDAPPPPPGPDDADSDGDGDRDDPFLEMSQFRWPLPRLPTSRT
jgi:hypothetical protein